ncbi:TIGR03546 family protein [Adhaeretor mobilis]|uniref:DUF2062 domain-containing protein n=1 Tax=Adhaeretor mobilis TaxID=1930276 RepID=A0A517MS44_9BACT|nr:TIGR03546 family protein [Adhaeretor mobilis]QDS97708.1 hypothetical protein HG15A2_09730 [Adhaeretor mobilis]
MLGFLLKPLRLLAQALTSNDSPRQVAWAIVLGVIIGLMPKGTLLALSFGILLCALRVNLSAGMMAVGIFSLIAPLLDPLAHRLGEMFLLWEPLRSSFAWLYQKPLGPWIGFNNTVGMGHLLIGIYLAYPAYRVGWFLGEKVQPRVSRWLMGYRMIRWLRGAEIGAHWGIS